MTVFWTGAALGAAAMYFFDPQHGPLRRETARETYERLRPSLTGLTARMGSAEPALRSLGRRARVTTRRVPVLRVLKGGKREPAQSDAGAVSGEAAAA